MASLGIMRKARCATVFAETPSANDAPNSPKPTEPAAEVSNVCKPRSIARFFYQQPLHVIVHDLSARSTLNQVDNFLLLKSFSKCSFGTCAKALTSD